MILSKQNQITKTSMCSYLQALRGLWMKKVIHRDCSTWKLWRFNTSTSTKHASFDILWNLEEKELFISFLLKRTNLRMKTGVIAARCCVFAHINKYKWGTHVKVRITPSCIHIYHLSGVHKVEFLHTKQISGICICM